VKKNSQSKIKNWVGLALIGCILPVLFFIMFHVVFVLLSDFAISLTQNCFFASLITFFENSTIHYVMCFCFWIVAVHSEGI